MKPNRRLVYINFDNEHPHSNFVTGPYDENKSCPLFEIPSDIGNTVSYIAAGDCEISWANKDNTHHTERIVSGSTYYFRRELITEKPKY